MSTTEWDQRHFLFELEYPEDRAPSTNTVRAIREGINYCWVNPGANITRFMLQAESIDSQLETDLAVRVAQLQVFRDLLLTRNLDPTQFSFLVDGSPAAMHRATRAASRRGGWVRFLRVFVKTQSPGAFLASVLAPVLVETPFRDLTPRQREAMKESTRRWSNDSLMHHPGCAVWSDQPCSCPKKTGSSCTRCGSAEAEFGVNAGSPDELQLCLPCAGAALTLLEAHGFARYKEVKSRSRSEAPDEG